ncbi:ribosome hibernation factor-recruiting GTPase MRF [Pseudonocardia hispaniensis]|uniref:Ribosome hibernation factor-recruiting GTPase MRF n=1 Tax=Pseudonocardia hispaniensis TaxID=904933 RepID=A0ABW1J3T6_9PSEU
MAGNDRTDLLVVAGGVTAAAAGGIEDVIGQIRRQCPAVAVAHHDLRDVGQGVVRRRLRVGAFDETTVLELAHGCVSCTLREDVLPLLRSLARRPDVGTIVLHLDAALEPEQVCWAVTHVLVDGAAVTDSVNLRGVISVLDAGSWLEDATGEDEVSERRLAPLPDDDRTMAQLVVGQAEFADLIVYAGSAEPWQLARTDAVLARLTPLAPRLRLAELDHRVLLTDLPPDARRGRCDDPHVALLRGQPPLHTEVGVQLMTFTARRPFHPDRLHRALDALLDGVVRTRGRIWLATRPSAVLWLESAGGGLQLGYAGDWLAGADAADWRQADPERSAFAALRWDERWGDRGQDLAILVHDAEPGQIDRALRTALLTDREIAAGEAHWASYPDPFGWWHTDPCGEITPQATVDGHKEDTA